jgi:hypothetical protein
MIIAPSRKGDSACLQYRPLLRQAIGQKELSMKQSEVVAAARSFIAFLIGLNTLSKVVRDEDVLWMTCRHYLSGSGVDETQFANSLTN